MVLQKQIKALYTSSKLDHGTVHQQYLEQGTPATNWSMIQYTSKNVEDGTLGKIGVPAIIGAR